MTVGEDFPREQARCRELLGFCEGLRSVPCVNVSFAVASIKAVLARADQAMASGDPVAILRAYDEMRGCE